MKNKDLKFIVYTSLIAAIYAILTISTSFICYGPIQFRIAEILTLLAFIDKKYILGLVLGCFLSNIGSPLGAIDWIFGTTATLISVYLISKTKNLFIASLWPAIINGLFIGYELYLLNIIPEFGFNIHPFILTSLSVAIGEFVVVSILGYLLFKIFLSKKNIIQILKFI